MQRRFFLAAALALLPHFVAAQAQTATVDQIRRAPGKYVNQLLSLTGQVARWLETPSASTKAFYLEDDYGHEIRVVIASGELPNRESRVTVTGVVSLDESGDPYLVWQRESSAVTGTDSATTALVPDSSVSDSATQTKVGQNGAQDSVAGAKSLPSDLSDADGDGVPDAQDHCAATPSGAVVDDFGCVVSNRTPLYAAVIAAGLLVVAFGTVLITRRRGQTPPPPVPASAPIPPASGVPISGSNIAPASQQSGVAADAVDGAVSATDVFEGRTIRFSRPPSGTLRMLPGRFEVVGGADKGQDIRFVQTGSANPEITIGRLEGPAYTHIQLRSPTVSRVHAKLRLVSGKWEIANFSETNPVVLNGQTLVVGGPATSLDEGDVVDFGEVSVRFRAR